MNRAFTVGHRAGHRLAGALLLVATFATFATLGSGAVSCRKKVSSKQCDELLDRFSELVVKEHFPDAGSA